MLPYQLLWWMFTFGIVKIVFLVLFFFCFFVFFYLCHHEKISQPIQKKFQMIRRSQKYQLGKEKSFFLAFYLTSFIVTLLKYLFMVRPSASAKQCSLIEVNQVIFKWSYLCSFVCLKQYVSFTRRDCKKIFGRSHYTILLEKSIKNNVKKCIFVQKFEYYIAIFSHKMVKCMLRNVNFWIHSLC